MIISFRDRETERIFNLYRSKKFSLEIQRTALKKLVMINSARNISDLLAPPGNRLEKLAGNREGQWSIRVNDQYRICFRWEDGGAFDVELTDYH